MTRKFIDPHYRQMRYGINALIKMFVVFLVLPALTGWTFIIWSVAESEDRYPQVQSKDWHSFLVSFGLLLVLLLIFFATYIYNRRNALEIMNSVRLEGVFDPNASDKIHDSFYGTYFGIDVDNGTFVYIKHVNNKEWLVTKDILVFGFDIHNWRSCELIGNKLTIYTNDPRIPFISIINRRTPMLFEKLNAMRNKDFSYPHSFPGWVDIKAQEAAEARGLNLIPIKY